MKVLLVGDYSGVHSKLSEVLRAKGVCVKLISDGDGYKKFSADIFVNYKLKKASKLCNIYLMFSELIGIKGCLTFIKKWKTLKNEIKGYDVVQLINPIALSGFGSIVNLFFLYYLKKYNKEIFLCALGDDYYWVKDCLKNNSKYIALNNINYMNFHKQFYSTKYIYGFLYRKLNIYAIKISKKIIPGLYDYQRVYSWSDKMSKLVPLPIEDKNIGCPIHMKTNEKIIIFHGWQKGKELRKGNIIFDNVAKKICKDFPDKVIYEVVQNVPYDEYVKLFNSSHIALDQCFAYDKGMNGLLFMAAGKVTFTGMEKEALLNYSYYDPQKIYGINATFDEDYLYDQLSILVNNPKKIDEISQNAIDFVLKNHLSDKIANTYIEIWGNSFTFPDKK